MQTKTDREKNRRLADGPEDAFIGVKMGSLFAVAKECMDMPLTEIDKLLESDIYEARMGAVCIMDFRAREKGTTNAQRKSLFELYLGRHDRIDTWDMVDRAAPHVVGGYLADKPRGILYQLARSKNPYERRTAMVSTWFFIRQNDLDDTFRIAQLLVNDPNELVHKAVGSWVREAGKRDKKKLLAFLEKNALTMPRIALRYAVEKLGKKEKDYFMAMAGELRSLRPKKKK